LSVRSCIWPSIFLIELFILIKPACFLKCV